MYILYKIMGILPWEWVLLYRGKKNLWWSLMPKPKLGLSCLVLRPALVKVRGGGGLDPNRLTFRTGTSTWNLHHRPKLERSQ